MSKNAIFVIESLGDDDKKTGKELYDDVINKFKIYNDGFYTSYKNSKNKIEFIGILKEIAKLTKNKGIRPIIHIEAHGYKGENENGGLKVEPSGECLQWKEIIVILREINIELKNSLFITLGVCFGFKLSLIEELGKPAPYFELVAPVDIIIVSEIIEGYNQFYQALLFGNNIFKAVKLIKKTGRFNFLGSAYLYEKYIEKAKDVLKRETYDGRIKRIKEEYEGKYDKDRLKEYSFEIYKKGMKESLLSEMNHFLMIDICPENKKRFVNVVRKLQDVIDSSS